MQTVLGAGGPIADELIRELHRTHTQDIRVVSRKPARVNMKRPGFSAVLIRAVPRS